MNFEDTNEEYLDRADTVSGGDSRRCKYCQTDISHKWATATICGSHECVKARSKDNDRKRLQRKKQSQVKRQCKYCGTDISDKRKDAIFCQSRECTNAHAAARRLLRHPKESRTCKYCNVDISHRRRDVETCTAPDCVTAKNRDYAISYARAKSQCPEVKAKRKEYRNRPEVQARRRELRQRPDAQAKQKAWKKEYNQRADVKERARERAKERYYRPDIHKKRLEDDRNIRQTDEWKAYMREYRQRPEVKARKRITDHTYYHRPDVNKRMREEAKKKYNTPEGKAKAKEYANRPEVREYRREYNREWSKSPNGRRHAQIHFNAADIDLCIAEATKDNRGRPLCIYSGVPLRVEGNIGAGKACAEHIDPDLKGTKEDGPDNWVIAEWSVNTSKSNRCLFEWHESERHHLGLRPLEDIIADMIRLGKTIPQKKT